MSDADQTAEPVVVPHTSLQPATLRALIEEFVNREGTDYGNRERTLDEKCEDVVRQLKRGDAVITFDPETQSASIVPGRGGGIR